MCLGGIMEIIVQSSLPFFVLLCFFFMMLFSVFFIKQSVLADFFCCWSFCVLCVPLVFLSSSFFLVAAVVFLSRFCAVKFPLSVSPTRHIHFTSLFFFWNLK
ncbi:hypothetical protein QBC43DRAFT_311037 [Cladorrhinum sp. PSN259]|nr:hypothetical protein QBC43DRAFT_311037 [Cladorrhinum sp. PSN259]